MKTILSALTLLIAASLSAQNYNYQTIDVPGATSTQARGINNAGDIVGIYSHEDGLVHGFLLSGGTFTYLDCPGAAQTAPRAINNRGQIVGWIVDNNGAFHGVLIDHTVCHSFDIPGAAATLARSINDQEIIAGDWNDNVSSWCFVMKHNKVSSFGFPGQTVNSCTGINNAGYVVGFYQNGSDFGFILRSGQFSALNIAGDNEPLGMNDLPQVVGAASNGYMADIAQVTTIVPPGANFAAARGINLKGVIVGSYSLSGINHGFVATPAP